MGCILSISQHFFESLNPLQGFSSKNDLEAYLYNRSLEIEPKETDKPPNFVISICLFIYNCSICVFLTVRLLCESIR
ncbi:Son of sevenless protein [Trichinella spiralis]|uniref:Son of sevenless protein n=1 Tax=Trichinella spiralis TaxID=6334 RepID=UPI0001EFCD0E|nr:Son of sevenless protein [Trichinella spiralis]